MKVTPLEIRQKAFEKKLRGYDKDEVNAYMQSLSQEWERLIEENKDLKTRLDNAEKDVQRLREVEASLFKTLKTAEDTGASMIDQANKAAELHVKESQIQADAILNDAKNQAKNMIEEAESKVKERLESARDQLRILEADCKLIDNHRDNLLIELKSIANETISRVEKLQGKHIEIPSLESKNLEFDTGALSFEDLEDSNESAVEEVVFEISNSNKLIDEDTVEKINEVTPTQDDQKETPEVHTETKEDQDHDEDIKEDILPENNEESNDPESSKDKGSFFDSL